MYPSKILKRIDPDRWIGVVLPRGYEIVELIGGGGMGAVFRGVQRKLDRSVAIKVIYPDVVESTVVVRRFMREARAMSRLNHPNALAIIEREMR